MNNFFRVLILFISINSCSYPEIIMDKIVYQNDFELNSLEYISGGAISSFNNSNVIGNFNNDGFTIHVENVDKHDYIFISFDLYIHGTWDGNFNGFVDNDKADKWIMKFNPEMELHNAPDQNKFETTFSNSTCYPNYCLRQSYPQNYPYENNPLTGSYKTNLEDICDNNFFGGDSSLYKIEKGFKSSGSAIVVRFYDELYQPNAIDKDGLNQQKCDESWSMDNIIIRVIKYE